MPRLAHTRDNTARETLTRKFAPIILLDRNEPFPFTRVAATILTPGQPSPSSDLTTHSDGTVVIEYALWADLEIGHAYELEHIWIHLDAVHTRTRRRAGSRDTTIGILGEHAEWEIVAVYGSAHGHMRDLTATLTEVEPAGAPTRSTSPARQPRLRVPCEPGKHGFAPTLPTYPTAPLSNPAASNTTDNTNTSPVAWAGPRDVITTLCGAAAGIQGVHPTVATLEPHQRVAEHRRTWRHLRGYAFTPTWEHTRELDTRDLTWEPLPRLLTHARRRALAATDSTTNMNTANTAHHTPENYVQVPTGPWGHPTADYWYTTGTLHNGEPYINGEPAAWMLTLAAAAHHGILVFCNTDTTRTAIQNTAHQTWTSSILITVSPTPHIRKRGDHRHALTDTRHATHTHPRYTTLGAPLPPALTIASLTPTPHNLCIAPGGDLDTPSDVIASLTGLKKQ